MSYERVSTLDHQGHRMTVTLRIESESDAWLTGTEVTSDGVAKSGKGYDTRLHYIDKGTITRRVPLRMNNHYGELEVETA